MWGASNGEMSGLGRGGEGQLAVSPGVPFRLLVTACPARNVFFKTRLSSNAGYYNNKRTSSAVWEDASVATLNVAEVSMAQSQEDGDRLKTHSLESANQQSDR